MSAYAATARASWLVFRVASVVAGVGACLPLLLGHVPLAAALFVMSFGVCWLALGPVILMVAGAIDLTRAVDRAFGVSRPGEASEALGRVGQLAVLAVRPQGRVSLAEPSR